MAHTAHQGPNFQTNPDTSHEAWSPSKKQKLWMSVAGVALAAATVGFGVSRNAQKSVNRSPATAESTADAPIPAGARPFIQENGSRYSDPVATYYANENIVNMNGGKGFAGEDNDFNDFEITIGNDGDKSVFGLKTYEIPIAAEANSSTSLDVFNEYTSKQLWVYMNLIAKNPDSKVIEILDSEFINYSSDNNNANLPETAFTEDDEYVANLMKTAKSIVDKYGSNSNYSIAPAVLSNSYSGENATSNTIFIEDEESLITEDEESGIVTKFSNVAQVVFLIDTYDNKGEVTHNKEVVDMQLSIIRHKLMSDNQKTTTISIGQY